MDPFTIEYKVTLSDFRKATYYALFLRHRRPLLIMFIVLIGALLYAGAAFLGLGTPNPLVFLLAGAYLVWGLLLFAGEEKTIRAYVKNPENFLLCTYRTYFDQKRIHIRIPERTVDVSREVRQLACAFEISALFMIYTTPQEVYLVPKSAMTAEQITALRENLRTALKDRFSAGRFGGKQA